MTQNIPEQAFEDQSGVSATQTPSVTTEVVDEEWFSSAPPRSTRRPVAPSSVPPPPIGDDVADDWFR